MSTSYGGTPPGITGTHYGGADIGIPAELIPADGLDGAGYPYAGLSFPADTGKLIRAPITRWPAGALVVEEDGAFTYTGANDYALYLLYVDGAASTTDIGYGAGIGRFDLNVQQGTLGGGVLLDQAGATGALGGGVPSGLAGDIQLGSVDAVGQVDGVTGLIGGVQLGDVAPAGEVVGVPRPVRAALRSTGARPLQLAPTRRNRQ